MSEENKGPIAEARALVESYIKPEVRTLKEPGTDVAALAVLTATGASAINPAMFDPYREVPLFRRGTAEFTTIGSIIDHANRFKDDGSAIFANDDRVSPSITTVLDYHESGGIEDGTQRHGRHRGHFAFPLSDEWKAWIKANGVVMSMRDFALFIEDRLPDVLDLIAGEDELPEELEKFINSAGGASSIASSAGLLELSRGLVVNEESSVREAVRLSSGEGQISFQSEHLDASGNKLRVPSVFLIAIPVFRNGHPYRIAARLRYRKTGEGVKFWYDLWRADRAFDNAFSEACERVRVETELPLFFGQPE